jgi:hypothetical protein
MDLFGFILVIKKGLQLLCGVEALGLASIGVIRSNLLWPHPRRKKLRKTLALTLRANLYASL